MKKLLFLLCLCFVTAEAVTFIEKYPEILWLADEGVRKTEEAQGRVGKNPVEYERTLMTLKCLHCILNNDYDNFVSNQKQNERLTRNSFDKLHTHGRSIVKSGWGGLSEEQMIEVLETALVLGDMGKSPQARKVFSEYGVDVADHDQFYEKALQVLKKHPELVPSFEHLPKAGRVLICKIGHLAHYGHITHIEGGPSMFAKLKKSGLAKKDPTALSFDLFVQICDVAGALGHVDDKGSLAYTELTHRALSAMQEAIWQLKDHNELYAFNYYLTIRAQWLGLNPNKREHRVLARLGAMLRFFTPEEGAILMKAFSEIEDKEKVLRAFEKEFLNTPTYVPAMLVNLKNKLSLIQAIQIGVPFIAEVFLQVPSHSKVTLNFNPIAGVAKTSPESIGRAFIVDADGYVLLESN